MSELDIILDNLNAMIKSYKEAKEKDASSKTLRTRWKYCLEGVEMFKANLIRDLKTHTIQSDEGTGFYKYHKLIGNAERLEEVREYCVKYENGHDNYYGDDVDIKEMEQDEIIEWAMSVGFTKAITEILSIINSPKKPLAIINKKVEDE